jgi:hypothetical protein
MIEPCRHPKGGLRECLGCFHKRDDAKPSPTRLTVNLSNLSCACIAASVMVAVSSTHANAPTIMVAEKDAAMIKASAGKRLAA